MATVKFIPTADGGLTIRIPAHEIYEPKTQTLWQEATIDAAEVANLVAIIAPTKPTTTKKGA
jgi:hypothetical protein